jgi:hypothetical protein
VAKKLAIVIGAITIPLLLTGCGLKQPVKRVVATTPTPAATNTIDTTDSTIRQTQQILR